MGIGSSGGGRGERRRKCNSTLDPGSVLCPLDIPVDILVSGWIMSLGLRGEGRAGD